MKKNKLKVLYIAGANRSGSTILHNILGQLDGFWAAGQVRDIWEQGFIKNRLCGCGIPFRECPVWQTIFHAAFGGMEYVDAQQLFQVTDGFRLQQLLLASIPGLRGVYRLQLETYLQSLEKLYWAIKATTSSRVIVDSSKTPAYAYLLQRIPEIDFYVIHLVRGARGAAYSGLKDKLLQPFTTAPEYIARKPTIKSVLQWDARNLTAEIFLRQQPNRYMMLRYEDFVNSPQSTVLQILNLLGEEAADLPFVGPHTVNLTRANHSVYGNPVRFETGVVELHPDNQWRTHMHRSSKVAATLFTGPLLHKYGYV
jgi:hypothetical protein